MLEEGYNYYQVKLCNQSIIGFIVLRGVKGGGAVAQRESCPMAGLHTNFFLNSKRVQAEICWVYAT